MGLEIGITSLEQMCDLMCGGPEEEWVVPVSKSKMFFFCPRCKTNLELENEVCPVCSAKLDWGF